MSGTEPGRSGEHAVGRDIAAILIDADGVLQWTPDDWYDVLHGLGGPGFPEACFELERASLRGDGDFREHLRDYLVDRGLSVDVEDVLAPWLRIEADEGALAVVAEVRRGGTPAYLASNQQAVRAAHMRATMGYDESLDGCFYSYALGVAKPDPAYFVVIADALGLPPARLLFVDDRADNVASARSVGLHAEVVPERDGGARLRAILTAYGLLDRQE